MIRSPRRPSRPCAKDGLFQQVKPPGPSTSETGAPRPPSLWPEIPRRRHPPSTPGAPAEKRGPKGPPMLLRPSGDIHGQTAALDRAMALIAAERRADRPLISLGDLCRPRAPTAAAVLDQLISGPRRGAALALPAPGRSTTRSVPAVSSPRRRTHDPKILSGKGWLHPAPRRQRDPRASYLPEDAFAHPEGGGMEDAGPLGPRSSPPILTGTRWWPPPARPFPSAIWTSWRDFRR